MKKFNINQFYPCNEGAEYYATQVDFESGWNNCKRGDWMLWIAKKLQVDDRILTLAKAYCANTVRHLMKDQRSLDAIDAAIKYGNGHISREELDKAAYAAADAASDAAVDAASHVASAAFVAADAYAASDAADAAYVASAASDATDADYVAAVAAADAASATDAKEENQLQTANICREYLTDEVLNKIK